MSVFAALAVLKSHDGAYHLRVVIQQQVKIPDIFPIHLTRIFSPKTDFTVCITANQNPSQFSILR